MFDIRAASADQIMRKVSEMGANYKTESQRIKNCLENVQATSVVRQAMSALQG